MENKEIELKEGDVLFTESRYHGVNKVKVARLTKTQIIIEDYGDTRLRKPFINGCSAIGSSGYGVTSYYIPTPQLEAEYQRKLNDKFIGTFAWKTTSNENTQLIVDFLKTLK